ncbi:MAG: MMPL family transporter, partial [Nanoarchaeota archaeon]|nr:MMPL family transporter [Nanoarchaeota archaeon]
ADYSVREAVSNVGLSLTASGTTTLIGFLALGLSIFPVLSDLGVSLAIGIAFMLSATIFAAPVILLIEDRIERKLKGEKEVRHEQEVREKEAKKLHLTQFYQSYGRFVSQRPWIVLSIAVVITMLMFVGISMIENQDVDFETILPSDLQAMVAYLNLIDEFGDTSSVLIYVSIEPDFPGSNEPQDIRDPRVLDYVDRLSQKGLTIQNVEGVESISQIVKENNGGRIPDTVATQRETFEDFRAKDLINQDYSATLIQFTVDEDAYHKRAEVSRQFRELIAETEGISGVKAELSGGIIIENEMDHLNGPDSQKTSLVSLIGIVVFLYLLTRSVKNTFLPLMTVVLGVIWTLGLGGFFGVPFNNITTSVITMTIGIGIDFGLQIMTRYNYELEKYDKKKAMEVALTNIMSPMIITVVAALVGFRAMSLGQLNIMGDLGTMMSFGVAGSMLAAITGVSALIVIFQRNNNNGGKNVA